MYKEVLRAIEGISIYPIISLTIFFLSFTFMMVRVMRTSKKSIEYMSDLPLGSSKEDNIITTN